MERFLLNKKIDKSRQSDQASTSDEGVKRRKHRKYDDSYLNFGFTSVEVNHEERPQCVLCLKILAVENMLPSKLKRHLETIHPTMVGKSREFFTRMLQNVQKQKKTCLLNKLLYLATHCYPLSKWHTGWRSARNLIPSQKNLFYRLLSTWLIL